MSRTQNTNNINSVLLVHVQWKFRWSDLCLVLKNSFQTKNKNLWLLLFPGIFFLTGCDILKYYSYFFHIDIYVEISPTPVIFYSNHNLGRSEKLIVIEHRNSTRALSLASSRRSWLCSSKLNTCALMTPTRYTIV